VYNIICDSLNLVPKPNNGTIRLPFKPVGVHSPENSLEELVDPIPAPSLFTSPSPSTTPPPSPTSPPPEEPNTVHASPVQASPAAESNAATTSAVGVTPPEDASVERPVVEDEGNKSDGGIDFLSWIKHKLDKVKGWIGELVSTEEESNSER